MLKSILSFMKQQRAGLGVLALTAALCGALFLASGCKVTDFVSVDVPQQVQDATGAPARVTLTDAPMVMEDYIRYGDRFQAEIDDGNRTLGWFMAVGDIGLRIGAAQLPVGGLGLSLLTGLGGLLLKGPGTAKEKEKSYKAGKDEAEATLIPLLTAAGIKVPAPKEDDSA